MFQVMEKAEHLRDADANILPAFLRLQELVRKSLYVCPQDQFFLFPFALRGR